MGRRSPVVRRSYGLVAVATGCYTCMMFVWFSLPAYLSIVIEDLGLTSTEAGILAGAVPLTYIPLALFSGLVIDRVGPARSLVAGVLVFGVAQVGRSGVSAFGPMVVLTLVVGVGGTMVTFGLPKLVSLLFPSNRTGLPSAVYLVGAQAGTAGAFAIGRPVLGPLLGGWRSLFFWSGVVTMGYACVWGLVAWFVSVRSDEQGEDLAFSAASIARDVRTIVSHRQLRLVVVVGTMYLFVLHGMQGWLPTILESRGLGAAVAGRTTSLLILANVLGILLVPTIADAFTARRKAILACGVFVFTGIVGIVVGTLGPVVVLGIVLTGCGVGGLSPLVRAMPTELDDIGPRLTGTAVGFVFAIGEIGGFLGPVLVGTSYDLSSSYLPGLVLLSGAGVVVVLVSRGIQDV